MLQIFLVAITAGLLFASIYMIGIIIFRWPGSPEKATKEWLNSQLGTGFYIATAAVTIGVAVAFVAYLLAR